MRILVTGASGYVGSVLMPRLAEQGHELRALARDPSRIAAEGVEALAGDVLSGQGLAGALAGVEVAYYLIHSMETLPSVEPAQFPRRESAAAHNFATAARRAGVRRIVYLGGMAPRERPVSRHLASRLALEGVFRAAVPDSVALRASIIVGARSRSFRFLVRLIERMPVITLPGWRRYRTQPIDGRDVVALLAGAATSKEVGGLSLDIGGPDVLTYEQIIDRIAELMVIARPSLRLGVSLTPIAARVAASITREDPELILPLMEGLESDLLASDQRAFELLDVVPHSFDSAVERALREWEQTEPLSAR